MKKTCTVCAKEKPLIDFYRKLYGHQARCKACNKEAINARGDMLRARKIAAGFK